MERGIFSWQNVLSELNDFENNIEILQSKTRCFVVNQQPYNFNKYINSLSFLVNKHKQNMIQIINLNDSLYPSFAQNNGKAVSNVI